jgi:hypothetical protein
MVALGDLPGNTAALSNALSTIVPNGSSDHAAAVQGFGQTATSYAATSPTTSTALVLLISTDPTACSETPQDVISAVQLLSPLPTYVIGVDDTGGFTTFFSAVATAGGTGSSIDVISGGGVAAAMSSVVSSVRSCALDFPGGWDPSQTNLQITLSGGQLATIPQVNAPGSCSGDGWSYDDNTTPTKVIACPVTCAAAFADPSPQVTLFLGCATVKAPCVQDEVCAVPGQQGPCAIGVRSCPSGTCTQTTTPSGEICNGVDDSCDGVVDENGDVLCSDGIACNGTETCAGISGCQSGSVPNCNDGFSCTIDSCAEPAGCAHAATNAFCTNGDACDGLETCDPSTGNATTGCKAGTPMVCTGGMSCVSGTCQCPGGTSNCGGTCVDTSSDPANCNGCGIACNASTPSCVSGSCK